MTNKSNNFIIAKEAFKVVSTVAFLVMVVVLTTDHFFFTFASLLIFAITLYLFRNPERIIERGESTAIRAVCDGVISNIETIECKGIIQGECLKVSITNRLIDIGVLRTPFDGSFALNETLRGMQLATHSPKSLQLNEQAKVMFQSEPNENKIVIKHYVNRFNVPISLYPKVNDKLLSGERYGYMLHGTILVFLPACTRLNIKKGDEVKAGETILGFFSQNK